MSDSEMIEYLVSRVKYLESITDKLIEFAEQVAPVIRVIKKSGGASNEEQKAESS